MKLKLCAGNPATPDAATLVAREFPLVRVHIAACLRKCGPCRERLVAVLDDEAVTVDGVAGLIELLRRATSKDG